MRKPQPDRNKIEEIVQHYLEDDVKFDELLAEYFKEQQERIRKYYEENPADAPNNVLNWAIVQGLAFHNDEVLAKGDFTPLLQLQNEELYLWTFEEDVESKMVVKVSETVKEYDVWKTSVSILGLAFTLMSQLEGIYNFEYDWVYRFNHKDSLDKLHYRNEKFIDSGWTTVKKLNDVKQNVNLFELLDRDEQFFVAAQNLVAAKVNHDFCQICALTPEHWRKHHDHEPEIWEKVDLITKMEVAIVQATRAVEALLGKPGNRSSPSKLERVKDRWNSKIAIDPDDTFELVGKSYIDYYYDLFAVRGDAAHSIGKFPFNVSRQLTIDAQSFAWIILGDYFRKHSLTNDDAIQALNANKALLDKVPENYSTNRTKK